MKNFDDGSFECFNFWIADDEGLRQVDASFIDKTLGLKDQVIARMNDKKSYLTTRGLVYGGLQILEVQWG